MLARQNTSAPTVGVECLDGFKFPALVVAVLFSRRLWKMMTLTTPSTNWAPGVCFGAARAFGYKLAQDVLSILGRRRRCYGHRRCRHGPASLGRRGRRAPARLRRLRWLSAPARLRLLRWTPAWRWSSPAACSVLGPRARRCSLATPRPRALASPARARPRARPRAPPVASPIVTRAVCSAVHARALTSHTRLTPFGSCRTIAFRCAAITDTPTSDEGTNLYAKMQKAQSTRASGCKDTSKQQHKDCSRTSSSRAHKAVALVE